MSSKKIEEKEPNSKKEELKVIKIGDDKEMVIQVSEKDPKEKSDAEKAEAKK